MPRRRRAEPVLLSCGWSEKRLSWVSACCHLMERQTMFNALIRNVNRILLLPSCGRSFDCSLYCQHEDVITGSCSDLVTYSAGVYQVVSRHIHAQISHTLFANNSICLHKMINKRYSGLQNKGKEQDSNKISAKYSEWISQWSLVRYVSRHIFLLQLVLAWCIL